jgi:2-deoxy-D-gluconate 3-dehydrogenase
MNEYIKNLFDLSGKNAIVTGAAQGMGRSMAEALMEAGARVALVDYSDQVQNTCKEIDKSGEKALPFIADLSKREDIDHVFEKVLETFEGKIDILVNNAGITRRHMPEDFPREDWDAVMAVNLNAVWFLSQLAGRVMLKQHSGKIINMASMSSYFGGTTVPAYTAAKGGVAQLTKALSNDWARSGICVNAIAPGYINTALNTALVGNPDREPKIMARIPKGRWGLPDDMKGTVVFLASSASDYVSGAVIPVDGGYLGA